MPAAPAVRQLDRGGRSGRRNADADLAEGFALSAGTKYLRASGYYLAAERMQSRDYAPRWAAYDKGWSSTTRARTCADCMSTRSRSPTRAALYRIFVHDGSARRAPRWSRSMASIP
jgi:hypothetical protein